MKQDLTKFGFDKSVGQKYLDFEVVAAVKVSEWDEHINEEWVVVGERDGAYFVAHVTPMMTGYMSDAWGVEYEVPVEPGNAVLLMSVVHAEEYDVKFGWLDRKVSA